MAKPAGTGYSPLNWYDRLQLRAAAKHLHSRYASVRAAAHAEIKRILQKRRGLKTRVQRGQQRLKERVQYGRLHRCNVTGCNHATRDQAMVQAHLRKHQREVIPKAARKQQPSGPARARDAGQRAPDGNRAAPQRAPVTVADLRARARADRDARKAARTARKAPAARPVQSPRPRVSEPARSAAQNGSAPRTDPALPSDLVRARPARTAAPKARTTRIRLPRRPLSRSRV